MIDYKELRRKFPEKRQNAMRKSSKAAIKAIAREYEMKKAELTGAAPVMKKGIVFYAVVIIGLLIVGSMVLSVCGKGGRTPIPLKPMQARKSMDSLAVALGRFKFHTGEYPSNAEGLGALAAKQFLKKGWDGPYVNHIVPDPWGNEYVYETRPEGGHPVLYSKGADGRAGTTDDVLPEQEQFEIPFKDTSWTNGWAPYRLRGVVVAPDEETKRRVQEEMKLYDPK
jgi:general secretion pathway protein G